MGFISLKHPNPKHIVIPDSQHILIPDPKSIVIPNTKHIVIPDSDRESKHITPLSSKKGDPQQNCVMDISFNQIPASLNKKILNSSLNGTEFIDFNKIDIFSLNDYKNIKSHPELSANA